MGSLRNIAEFIVRDKRLQHGLAEKFGAAETYPFDKLRAGSQGLKPNVFSSLYGPTKVVH
jgi:hypothetical protein